MSACKPSSTPIDVKSKLSAQSKNKYHYPMDYWHLVGALQYLTLTRPDIYYDVQHVCLLMRDPRTHHMYALKRIIRYVKGTLEYGLYLSPSSTHKLLSYADVDWGGYPDTQRSTSGYLSILVTKWSLGLLKDNLLSPALMSRQNTAKSLMWFQNPVNSVIFF